MKILITLTGGIQYIIMHNIAIASQSANQTKVSMTHTQQLLKYLESQDEAVLTYNMSGMVLTAHSDTSYLS